MLDENAFDDPLYESIDNLDERIIYLEVLVAWEERQADTIQLHPSELRRRCDGLSDAEFERAFGRLILDGLLWTTGRPSVDQSLAIRLN